jgi:hypothetical protein
MKTPTPKQRVEDTAAMFQHVANFGGGPASPMQVQYGLTDGVPNIWFAVGMTKREAIAARVLQGFCANPAVFAPNASQGWSLVNCSEQILVKYALQLADTLLSEKSASNESEKT